MTGKYVIVRTNSAGCFAGIVETMKGKRVVLIDARRLWYWAGAASLSELAMRGPNRPCECKFPCPVGRIILTEAIEVIETTAKAEQAIREVPEWKA